MLLVEFKNEPVIANQAHKRTDTILTNGNFVHQNIVQSVSAIDVVICWI